MEKICKAVCAYEIRESLIRTVMERRKDRKIDKWRKTREDAIGLDEENRCTASQNLCRNQRDKAERRMETMVPRTCCRAENLMMI